jgi:hypothetical protein
MKNKKHIMVCNGRFLASLEKTAISGGFSAANRPFSHTQRVMSNKVKHLLKPLQVNNFICLKPYMVSFFLLSMVYNLILLYYDRKFFAPKMRV